ncbi:MAG: ferrous iron transporter B [Pseudomonadota bacterium]
MQKNEQTLKKIFIVGLPNTGKSLIFTNLTGQFTIVANQPMTTLSFMRAPLQIGARHYQIVDTPGMHSLYIHSEEQKQVRDAIFSEKPEMIIQCFDANRLKQSLTLTADLLELEIPMIVCLNAVDETVRKGIWIDSNKLSQILGVPVIESIAVQARGTRELKNAFLEAGVGKREIPYGSIIEDGLLAMASALPPDMSYKRMIALLMLMGDPLIPRYLENTCQELTVARFHQACGKVKAQFKGNLSRIIDNCRSRWIDDIVDASVKKQKIEPREFSQTVARLSRHPVFGIPILLGVLYIMFFMVVHVANVMAEWMNRVLWVPVETAIGNVIPPGFWQDFFIGHYGVLSLGLANALLTVLPILSVFFILFNTLEDIGYIPNLSVLTKRLLAKLGLSGNAIMPLVLGFSCKTMATLTTRNLYSKKERYIAIYLIAFAIPCAAQIGLNMSILGHLGAGAFFITFSVLSFVEITAGIALNKILKDQEDQMAFIMELPPIRLPDLKAVAKKTYYRLYWFLRESLMVFIYAALALFALEKLGILNAGKKVLSPVIKGFLGLPLDMVDAIFLSMARHEAAAALIINLIRKGQMNYVQSIVAVVLTTMFVPCFANIMAMAKEIGGKNTLIMVLTINFSAFVAAGVLNWVLVILL